LAADLAEQGVESVYMERIRRRVDAEQELKQLEQELAGEMARALGKTEHALNLALAELELLEARFVRLERARAGVLALEQAAQAFNAQRTLAERRLRDLVIHREAVGFRRNQQLYELFPIPARKRVGADP
jgi:predicted type IV restriction endonuclease